jgi:hypothetical protein
LEKEVFDMSLILAIATIVGVAGFLIDRLFGLSSSPQILAVVALSCAAIAAVQYATKRDPRVFTGGALYCVAYAVTLLLGWTGNQEGRMILILSFLILLLVSLLIDRLIHRSRKDET